MRLLIALLVVLAACPAGLAQQPLQARTDHLRRFDDSQGRSVGSGFGTGLVVEAGDADSQATISLSSIYSTSEDQTRRIGIKASAPFDRDKADSVDIGTLSGLTAGTSATFEFSMLKWPLPNPVGTRSAEELCANIIMDATGMEWQRFSVLTSLAAPNNPWTCSPGKITANAIHSAVRTLNRKQEACGKLTELQLADEKNESCREFVAASYTAPTNKPEAEIEGVLRQHNATKEQLSSMLIAAQAPLRMWTIGLSGNRQKFAYALPASPDEIIKEQESGSGIALAYTRLGGSFLWTTGISHETSYEAASSVDICSVINGTTSLQCSKASLGAPTETETELVFGEVRYLLLGGKIAIGPRLEFKTEGSDWALNFPIYMVKNSEGALTAGFAAGYTTKDDESNFSVFIGKEFAFFD